MIYIAIQESNQNISILSADSIPEAQGLLEMLCTSLDVINLTVRKAGA